MIDPKWVLLTCLACSLYMTGLIWFVDRVHYPLFERVEHSAFARYHADHSVRTTAVVIVPMIVELVTSGWLVWRRPPGTDPGMAWASLVAVVATWAATAILAVPMHRVLGRGFDVRAHRRLVRTNLIRVAAWTVHSGLLLVMTAWAMR